MNTNMVMVETANVDEPLLIIDVEFFFYPK